MEFLVEENRFYFDDAEGKNVAEITMSPAGSFKIIDHTWVDDSLRGQGVAAKLVKRVVDDAREKGYKVLPLCPFAKGEFDKKTEYHDVLKNA